MRSLLTEHDETVKEDWRSALRLLPYLWRYRLRVSIAVVLLIAAKLSGVGMPIILKHIIDGLDIGRSDLQQLLVVPLSLLLIYGLLRFSNVLFAELRDAVFSRVAERVIRIINLEVFRHLHQLDLAFHLDRKTGALSRDIERGSRAIGLFLRVLIFNVVPTLFEVILVIGILFFNYDGWFALIGIVSIVVYIVFSVLTTEWRTRFVRESNVMDNKANTRAIDSLLNYETVKYFGNEKFEENLYDQTLAGWEQAKIKTRLSLAILNSGQALIIASGITAMMILAANRVVSGDITLGDLVMVNAFMLQLFIPLGMLGFIYREMKAGFVDIERLFLLKDRQPKINDCLDAVELDDGSALVEFKAVHFGYHPERKIVNDLSFSVMPGQTIAFVGESGAGKSTLSKLLFRFYDVDKGAITIAGRDIRSVTQESLHAAIGVVPQDTVLFNDTLYSNIEYGCPGASKSEIERVVKLAHLEEFIGKLPEGYDTLVGERGLKLSGGEKQRVAIARVLLKKPSILIFDEATSSLDSRSEKIIVDAISDITENVTTLIIAHRLATVTHADKILVLGQGEILEQGSHHSLIQAQGVYAQMWQLQQNNEKLS